MRKVQITTTTSLYTETSNSKCRSRHHRVMTVFSGVTAYYNSHAHMPKTTEQNNSLCVIHCMAVIHNKYTCPSAVVCRIVDVMYLYNAWDGNATFSLIKQNPFDCHDTRRLVLMKVISNTNDRLHQLARRSYYRKFQISAFSPTFKI
jgi:hypothetical protein